MVLARLRGSGGYTHPRKIGLGLLCSTEILWAFLQLAHSGRGDLVLSRSVAMVVAALCE